MKLHHIINTKQFLDTKTLAKLFKLAQEMEKRDKAGKISQVLKNKILACVFYEPSTRTRFSFESAMIKLGGRVITTESASHFSSTAKGETLQDSIRVIGGYADAIVLRHPKEGSAQIASEASPVPVINAGDGSGDHPTQGLLDVYTIKKELGKIENLNIAFIGDLLYGRTVHSLLYLVAVFKKVRFYFISPKELRMPKEYKDYLSEKGIEFVELSDLSKVAGDLDVLYVTRIQKERFKSKSAYLKVKDSYVIDQGVVNTLKQKAIIMHPLPRVTEIAPEIDNDKRAAYFRQAKNGLYIRMALLKMIFG